jgi:hypothetical protein
VRWRLIRSPAGTERQREILILASHDILGLSGGEQPMQSNVVSLLVGQNDLSVVTELVRLVSVMSSDHHGREYLLKNGITVINALYKVLESTPGAAIHRKEGTTSLYTLAD